MPFRLDALGNSGGSSNHKNFLISHLIYIQNCVLDLFAKENTYEKQHKVDFLSLNCRKQEKVPVFVDHKISAGR